MKRKTFYLIAAALIVFSGRLSFAQVKSSVMAIKSTDVSERVLRDFKGSFKNVAEPHWYNLHDNYLVKFFARGQKNSVLYDNTGYMIYHIIYGTSASLPNTDLEMVNNKYPGRKIINAIHVDQNQRSVWVVNMEVGTDLVLARIEQDQMEEVEHLHNAAAR
jgi:hypothetical protein